MNYCAGCGKPVDVDSVTDGKLRFHLKCMAQRENREKQAMNAITERRSFPLENKLFRKIVDLRREIQDAEAMLSVINHPPLKLVK